MLSGPKLRFWQDKLIQVDLMCIYLLKCDLSLCGDDVVVGDVIWSVLAPSVSLSLCVFCFLVHEESRKNVLCQKG